MMPPTATSPRRNAPCPCGSGLRFKACCGAGDDAAAGEPAYPGWDALTEGERRRLRERLREALDAHAAGRLELAGECYREVLALAPDTYDALHMLGVICYQAGDLDDAHRHLLRALELTDWRVAAMRHNLGLVLDAALARLAGGGDARGNGRGDGSASGPGTTTAVAPAVPRDAASAHAGPQVSVLVSTFNAAQGLGACLEDLLRQTLVDAAEVIVIDSGSGQDERSVARAYEGRFRHFVYLRTGRETLYAAWNRGIALARGRYVTNANTDDAHRPDALATMVAALDANPGADIAYCDYALSAAANDTFAHAQVLRTVRHEPYHPAQALFHCMLGCHPVWRRSLFAALGAFDPNLRAAGDYELLLRAVAAGVRLVHVPEVLSLFHRNPHGLTLGSGHAQREVDAIRRRYRARMPIERIFAVAPDDALATARAWTALGALATGVRVPWQDAPICDLAYAATCFRRATESDATHLPALAHLAALYASMNRWDYANALLERLPRGHAATVTALVQGGRYVYEVESVPPAVPPAEYRSAADEANSDVRFDVANWRARQESNL